MSFTQTKPEQKEETASWADKFIILFRVARKAFFARYKCTTKNAQEWVNFFIFCCNEYNTGKDIYNPAFSHFKEPSDIINKVSKFELYDVLNKTSPMSFTQTPEQKEKTAIWAVQFRKNFWVARKAYFSNYKCTTKNAQQWVNFFIFCCHEYNNGKDIYNPASYHFKKPSDIIKKVSDFENPPEVYDLTPSDGFSEIPDHNFGTLTENGSENSYKLDDLVPFDYDDAVDMLNKINEKHRLGSKDGHGIEAAQ
jgi:hypothetical protein